MKRRKFSIKKNIRKFNNGRISAFKVKGLIEYPANE